MKKRGVSAVVTMVLVLLMTVAGITIVAEFVIPFVKNSLEGSECVKFRNYFELEDLGYTCYQDNDLAGVTVSISDDSNFDKLEGFDLAFWSGGSSTKASVKQGILESCEIGGVRELETKCSDLGELDVVGNGVYSVLTYVYYGTEKYEKVDVHPVLKGGNVCPITDSIKLEECDTNDKLEP